MLEIRRPTIADFEQVADDVRQEDKNEWFAGIGKDFRVAVIDFFKTDTGDDLRFVAVEEATGIPILFWGADNGEVWMFATNRAYRNIHNLHKHLKDQLEVLHERYGTLHALADNRNKIHHKWLTWMGFKKHGEIPVGVFGMPFTQFEKDK